MCNTNQQNQEGQKVKGEKTIALKSGWTALEATISIEKVKDIFK
jgi:hypothetical protein